ncbi:protein of unknown function [Azospirillum baldaniorum]|uniref:Uncharacterized protein n=1 Tax=Azospirillum baldaniorum TaxID=1064539 RepID=A0A9P1NMZ6_9PROT|nr:protein of unknown function [Azospirillum baldaniorum]
MPRRPLAMFQTCGPRIIPPLPPRRLVPYKGASQRHIDPCPLTPALRKGPMARGGFCCTNVEKRTHAQAH